MASNKAVHILHPRIPITHHNPRDTHLPRFSIRLRRRVLEPAMSPGNIPCSHGDSDSSFAGAFDFWVRGHQVGWGVQCRQERV